MTTSMKLNEIQQNFNDSSFKLWFPSLLWPRCVSLCQNESCFRQDFLLKYKNRTEQDEIETRENLNRLLLENVLPAHVAALFVGENKKNEVRFFYDRDAWMGNE